MKRQKLRISVFLTVNADGSDKRKPMVIGRAAVPHAFKNTRINNNVSVVYRYNKNAWILSGIWYEYLSALNEEMVQQDCKIALVKENRPSHPRPNHPPKGYDGPPPPTPTHVTLIYLPKTQHRTCNYWIKVFYVEDKTGTSSNIHTLLESDIQSLHSGQMEPLTEDFLFYEEEATDPSISASTIVLFRSPIEPFTNSSNHSPIEPSINQVHAQN